MLDSRCSCSFLSQWLLAVLPGYITEPSGDRSSLLGCACFWVSDDPRYLLPLQCIDNCLVCTIVFKGLGITGCYFSTSVSKSKFSFLLVNSIHCLPSLGLSSPPPFGPLKYKDTSSKPGCGFPPGPQIIIYYVLSGKTLHYSLQSLCYIPTWNLFCWH